MGPYKRCTYIVILNKTPVAISPFITSNAPTANTSTIIIVLNAIPTMPDKNAVLVKSVKAELPHHSLHILRHSFGSKLIRNGVDVTIVSKLMGHSNITITYNKYIHVIQSQQIRAIELANVI